jgi:hypothetical protein
LIRIINVFQPALRSRGPRSRPPRGQAVTV